MAKDTLTVRQRRFADAYNGNGTEAARKAGYRGSNGTLAVTAYHLLRIPKVREIIDAREEGVLRRLVLTRDERQERWSAIACDPDVPVRDQLKALEALGRTERDFVDRLEHAIEGKTLETLVLGSFKEET